MVLRSRGGAGVIEPALQEAETARLAARPTSDLTAYDLYLRAYAMFLSSARQILEALRLLERAIERDPRYGPALAFAAFCRMHLDIGGWVDDRETNRRNGVALAREGLRAASDDPGVIANAAQALGYFGEDMDAAIALIDRSLALNPSFASGWFQSGWLRLNAGKAPIAIEHFEASVRLNPRDVSGRRSLVGIGIAHFFNRRFDDAVAKLLVSLEETQGWAMPYCVLAAAYAHMGRLDDAREIVKRLRAITDAVVPSIIPFRNPEHRELFLSGLRLAAGEET